MPRKPGPINNEFIATDAAGKSAMVLCKHCRKQRVAKASNKRKVAHLRQCVDYLRAINTGASQPGDEPIHDISDVPKQSIIIANPYWWPHDASFGVEKTALVIIDMQRDFCQQGGYLTSIGLPIASTRAIIPRLQRLLHSARAAHLPIYHTREGHRPDLSTLSTRERTRSRNNPSGLGIGDTGPLGRLLVRGEAGHDTIPELYPLPTEPVIEKPGRGAFAHTDFDLLLRIKGIKNLILTGVTTDVCVSSTMREANDRGYDCVVVEDCTAAASEEVHNGALKSVVLEGGIFGAVVKFADVVAAVESLAPREGRLLGGMSAVEQGLVRAGQGVIPQNPYGLSAQRGGGGFDDEDDDDDDADGERML
ncbi:hypothetical protein MBLNU457_7648t1 [Dothideomycetes sp. NU457]